MLRTKTADRIVCVALVFMLVAATCMWGVVEAVQGDGSHTVGYEDLLFDQGRVHTIDITMAEWDAFIENATAEEYTECNITVDGEKYNNVAIRAKGNTSLSSVATLNSTRYSFKVEFDHYVDGMTYHGLDKLSLNNMIQDATMMKDYLAYTLMNRMGVPSSLCSYVQVTVNGEDWGLYLAVEGIEDGFLERNGMTRGELYKPDSLSFGGGRGNGRDFDIEKFRMEEDETEAANGADTEEPQAETGSQAGQSGFGGNFQMPSGMGGFSGFGGNMTPPDNGGFSMPGSTDSSSFPSGGFSMPGSTDGSGASQFGGFSMPGSTDGNGASQFGGMPDMSGFSMPDGSAFSMPGSSDQDGAFSFGSMGGFGGFNFGMGSDDVKLVYT
ncbi:MAG: CotH kinase family protein, partial [Clostridia bacterium]|nr:CotH kinase family protein [Clostridia bacterium]